MSGAEGSSESASGDQTTAAVDVTEVKNADVDNDDDEDDYREVWLKIWNNSSNPKDISCHTALDILFYCISQNSTFPYHHYYHH